MSFIKYEFTRVKPVSNIYRQCLLRHPDGRTDVAFIPNHLAKVGQAIRIKRGGATHDDGCIRSSDGAWDDGWKVAATYAAKTLEELNEQRGARRHLEDNLEPHR